MKTEIVYRHAIEAVLDRVVRARKLDTPALRAELLGLGIDLDKPRDIERANWLKAVTVLARALTPDASETEALTLLGRAVLEGYADTLIGRGGLMLAKLQGPKKSLCRAAEGWATANNFYVVTAEEKGPKCVHISLNVAGPMTAYNRGILLAVSERLGITPTVEAQERVDGVTYIISWP